ncbi:MAG: phosphatase PAP2 family protein [Chloroflexota bacterium]
MAEDERTSIGTKIHRRPKRGHRGRGHYSTLPPGLRQLADLVDPGQLANLAAPTRAKGLSPFFSMPVPAVLASGFGASLIAPVIATKIADSMLSRQTRSFDHSVLDMARGARHHPFRKQPLDAIMTLLSAAGEPIVLYPVSALVAAWWVGEERADDAVTIVLGLIGSAGINEVLKRIVHRPRPIWKLPFPRSGSSGSSFPSNHATMSLATYGTVAYLLTRKRNTKDTKAKGGKGKQNEAEATQRLTTNRRAAALIWAPVLLFCGLIGWSRVYQGVHNPSDVLGGWLAGGIWLLTCSTAATWSRSKEGHALINLTRMRTRYGLEVFRRFFAAVVEQHHLPYLLAWRPFSLCCNPLSGSNT